MLTTEQKKQIITDAETVRAAKKLSCNAASALIQISNATYSNMLNGATQPNNKKWASIKDELWLKVQKWANPQASTTTINADGFKWPLMETKSLLTVLSLCKDAQDNSRMLSICADTGLGKTTGLKKYCSDTPAAYYVLCTVTMGRKDFVNAIARAIGLEAEGSIHARITAIINKLGGMKNPLLALDDVGKLNEACLRLVQIIYDELEGRCGIVLAGLHYFQKFIFKNAVRDKQGFPELRRRIEYWQPLPRPSHGFIKSVCTKFGIVEEKAISYLCNTVDNIGALEAVIKNYYRAPQSEGVSQLEVITSLHIGANNMEGAA